jgi:hypothetical protein
VDRLPEGEPDRADDRRDLGDEVAGSHWLSRRGQLIPVLASRSRAHSSSVALSEGESRREEPIEQRDGEDTICLRRFGVASAVFSQAAATAAASLG